MSADAAGCHSGRSNPIRDKRFNAPERTSPSLPGKERDKIADQRPVRVDGRFNVAEFFLRGERPNISFHDSVRAARLRPAAVRIYPNKFPVAVSWSCRTATDFMIRIAPNCSTWNALTTRVLTNSRSARNVPITWALDALPSNRSTKSRLSTLSRRDSIWDIFSVIETVSAVISKFASGTPPP